MEERKIDLTVGDNVVESTVPPSSAGENGVEVDIQFDQMEKLRLENEELQDKYKRMYAEFDNYRKRVLKEKEEIYKYGTESLVSSLLSVIDNLEAALSHVAPGAADGLAQGVDMTLKELKKILVSNGLAEIEAKGKPFNPAYHHAMAEVERSDLDDKTVVEEFRKGYIFKDRLIRAALVSVSKKASGSTEHVESKTEHNDINHKEEGNG
ncbi:nucleotide exchange factor GrpE [Candidatus Magnetobacterium casense]|uniref:Protein GrpE n=1 Tax=Candidatus Magnetobacterium casense TaxID=1455061 RepID=A0ABS6RZE5_9BACT|nr:nucleotide exchange factor GrpE [Candidatus Magnetobacterium casensis]MBV6341725.1 nucleotide exchange factor GrpE [Candidatus Magnetobacterium casensis]